MKYTQFKQTKDNTFVRAEYGLVRLGEQAPYFAITINEYKRAVANEKLWLSGGAQPDVIREYFPELAPLIQWHLCSHEGPMHYVANGLFWHDAYHGRGKYTKPGDQERAASALAGTIALGAVEGDLPVSVILMMSREELKTHLEARLPALLEAFQTAMRGANLT